MSAAWRYDFQNKIKYFWDTLILYIPFVIVKIKSFYGDLNDVSAEQKNTGAYYAEITCM